MQFKTKEIKWIAACIVTVAVAVAIIVTLIKFYAYLNQPQTDPYAVIPENSMIIVHSDSITGCDIPWMLNDIILQEDAIRKIKPILEIIYNKHLNNTYIEECKIAVFPKNGHYDFLWIASMKKDGQQEVENRVKHSACARTAYKGHTIYHDTAHGYNGYFYLYQNLLTASVSYNLLRSSINALESGTKKDTSVYGRPAGTGLYVSCHLSQTTPNTSCSQILYSLRPEMFGKIDLKINKDYAVTANADVVSEPALSSQTHKADISKYTAFLPDNTSRIFLLQESAYAWLRVSNHFSIEQNKWFQYFQPSAVMYFTLTHASGSTYSYVMISPKYLQETIENLFFLTQKDTLTTEGAHVYYDTFSINRQEVGRADIPNFVCLRWNIGGEMPRLKNYMILDDMILFAANDEACRFYLSSMNSGITKDEDFIQSEAYFTEQADIMYYSNRNHIYRMQMEQHDRHSCFLNIYYQQ